VKPAMIALLLGLGMVLSDSLVRLGVAVHLVAVVGWALMCGAVVVLLFVRK